MTRFRGARQRRLDVGIEGADEVIELLEQLGITASSVLEQAAKAGGELVLDDAKERCPVNTGALKASLQLKKSKSSKPDIRQAVRVMPGKKEYYGTFVELGTTHQTAQPFLRPAIDKNKEQIGKAVKREISRALGRIR